MYHFPGREGYSQLKRLKVNILRFGAHQKRAHGSGQGFVVGVMLPVGEVEIGPQLAVEAGEQVEVESRRDTLRIIVRRTDTARGLPQIEANEQAVVLAQRRGQLPQKIQPFGRAEIANVRAQEQHRFAARPGTQLVEGVGVAFHHGHHAQGG